MRGRGARQAFFVLIVDTWLLLCVFYDIMSLKTIYISRPLSYFPCNIEGKLCFIGERLREGDVCSKDGYLKNGK